MAKLSGSPSIRRLPSYLKIARELMAEGKSYVSGTFIAGELGYAPIQVRKDLAITGVTGLPRKGFPLAELVDAIERFLGWDKAEKSVLVGAGNLGTALLGNPEFPRHGLKFVAAFDKNPEKISRLIHNVPVYAMEEIEEKIPMLGARIAVLTVPSEAARDTAAVLARCGVEGVWNFTNVNLKMPENIAVQQEDLTSGYAMLCATLRITHPQP
jgi:redox-sensing transcriptional repressor